MQIQSFIQRSWPSRAAVLGVAAVSLGTATLAAIEPAQAEIHGGYRQPFFPQGGGFGRGGGGYRGGYGGGYRRGFAGGYGGGYHRRGYGYGYGLGGLGLGLALGTGLGYGAGYPGYYGGGYYGAGYGAYGYNNGCLRRVWGPYGPHWVNVCY